MVKSNDKETQPDLLAAEKGQDADLSSDPVAAEEMKTTSTSQTALLSTDLSSPQQPPFQTTRILAMQQPLCLAESIDIHGDGNFPQGCSFSPDGLCIATATASDATLRLYNTVNASTTTSTPPKKKEWKTALESTVVGEVIRSYDWYPQMQSSNPATCCIAATGRDQPVQLIDAYTGDLRATYSPVNRLDEMESPTVVKFSPAGDKIVTAGYRTDRMIQIFDSARPGKFGCTLQLGKTKRSSDGQKGLVSALSFNTSSSSSPNSLVAVGTYAPGTIYIYDFRQACQQPAGTIWAGSCVVGHGKKHSKKRRRPTTTTTDNHSMTGTNDEDDDDTMLFSAAKAQWYGQRVQRGITQLQFDADGKLYSASRNSDAVLVWDVRMLSGYPEYRSLPVRGYTNYAANLHTNQRLEFALDDASSRLWVGGCDGEVNVYDTSSDSGSVVKPLYTLAVPGCNGDAVNGLSYNATYDMLAVAKGSRRFPSEEYYNDEQNNCNTATDEAEGDNLISCTPPGSLQLYQWNSVTTPPE